MNVETTEPLDVDIEHWKGGEPLQMSENEAAKRPIQILQRSEQSDQPKDHEKREVRSAARSVVPESLKEYVRSAVRSVKPKRNTRNNWMNTVDPWSVEWIKWVADKGDTPRTLKHLQSFVHETRVDEVTPELVQQIRLVSPGEAYLSLRELQKKLRFVTWKRSPNSLEIKAEIHLGDASKIPILALLDSGCSASAIDETFVQEKRIPTYNLPIPIPVYNADGTKNTNGLITKFAMVELHIDDHSESLPLAITRLSMHTLFLGHDWLKIHNPAINWKDGSIKLTCADEHIPALLPIEDEEEYKGHEKEEERLFRIDVESDIRANTSTELAIEANKSKQTRTFEEVVPEAYHSYKDVFDKENFNELPPRRPWDHTVELLPGDHVIDCKMYNLTNDEQGELESFLEENLKSGRICPSKSPFASAFFFIKKKDSKLRPVQDYRKLNAITVKNRYPLPLISELIDKLKNAKYFTKPDIRWEYNNIRMKEGDEWKAAFRTNRGLFEPLVMFFGLTNSPATFQTMMNHLFRDLINQGKVVVYMDNIMIYTVTLEEHQRIVLEVLEILRTNKLYLKHTKCKFEQSETEYLGLIIGYQTVKMDSAKVKGVTEWPVPTTRKELRGFLGFLNFYRRFVKDFSKIARPLCALTSDKKEFIWDDDCQQAFDLLKTAITTAPALFMPTPHDPFHVETDGSGIGLDAVLSQKTEWSMASYCLHL